MSAVPTSEPARLDFDAVTHTYRIGGVRVPSVTQVCKVASGNEYAQIPRDVLERKRAIGVALHAAIWLDHTGVLDIDSIDPAVAPYFAAWQDFVARTGFVTRLGETQLGSQRFGYAGTLDLYGIIDGTPWLIDTKSVAVLSPVTAIQTAAYLELLRANHHALAGTRRAALHLKPDGRFALQEYTSAGDFSTFLAALSVWRWRAANRVLSE